VKLLTDIISKNLSFLIITVGVGTYLSPYYWKVSAWVPSFLLGVVILFTGVSMNIDSIRKIKTKKKELVIATVLKWTLTVTVSIILASVFFKTDPEIAFGFILSGTVPSATAATVYTFLAGGNTSLVIAASLVDIMISPIVTPLAMIGLSDESIRVSFIDLLQSFLFIVMLPLSIGIAIQRSSPQAANYSKSITKLGSSITLLLIVHTIVGSGKHAISSELLLLPTIVFATLLQVLFPIAASLYICRKLKIAEEDIRAILFQVGLCNTALAAILAFQFVGELGVIAPIVNMIINLSVGSTMANRLGESESHLLNVERLMR
jgi:bile acid:Na+ symporter, BASS family